MASKISGLGGAPTSVGTSRRAGTARDTATGEAASAESAASGDVEITRSASLLASIEQQLRDMPAVDEQRVEHFRTAIDSGSYSVRPQQVADQLIQTEQSLAQASGG